MEEQIPEIPEKPVQPEVISEIPPNKSYLKIVLLVILGLAVVAGAVYAGMNMGKKQTSPNQIISQPTEIPTVIPASPDETSTWKTYTNTEYGFEFKYPPYLIQKESSEYEDSTEISFEDENKSTHLTLRNIGNNTLTGKPFSSFAEVCPQCDEIGFLMRSFNNIGIAQYENTAFFFSKDKSNVFELILSRDPLEESKALLDQILSTLKFLD